VFQLWILKGARSGSQTHTTTMESVTLCVLPIHPHGGGVLRGAKVGNGVAVGAGVAVAAGIGVATCACAPAKKATKPTRTHTLRKAIHDRIRVLATGCGS
jgi:hypothetical protein